MRPSTRKRVTNCSICFAIGQRASAPLNFGAFSTRVDQPTSYRTPFSRLNWVSTELVSLGAQGLRPRGDRGHSHMNTRSFAAPGGCHPPLQSAAALVDCNSF